MATLIITDVLHYDDDMLEDDVPELSIDEKSEKIRQFIKKQTECSALKKT